MSQVSSWYEIDNKEEVKDEDNEDDKGEDGKEEVEKDDRSDNTEEVNDDDKVMFKAGQRCLLRFIKLLLLWDPQIAAAIIDIFHHFKSIIVFPFSYKQIIAQHSIKILPRFGWFCVPCHWKYWFINSFSGDLANKSELLRYKKNRKMRIASENALK